MFPYRFTATNKNLFKVSKMILEHPLGYKRGILIKILKKVLLGNFFLLVDYKLHDLHNFLIILIRTLYSLMLCKEIVKTFDNRLAISLTLVVVFPESEYYREIGTA